jgi:hypothetical protein
MHFLEMGIKKRPLGPFDSKFSEAIETSESDSLT